ncbi:MAG TPA: type II toxin-antitoxin system death-on-curing family toxin [Bacteroidota bacterium]|nr:type II toxin-antitoxin system death-on-curing family toxin [Bacteroidota bacterium]
MAIRFIPDEMVPIIHADLIHRYGGHPGLRDTHLLASALAQPKMTSGGKFLNRSIFDKAAAYGFHVCKNHPFIDGNKRLAFALMDIFLLQNGWEMNAPEEKAYATMIDLSIGRLTKAQLSVWLQRNTSRISR